MIGQGKVWIGTVIGEDASGNPAPISGNVTVSDYASAYVAATGGANEYMLVPKIVLPPGETVDINLTFSAKAADGSVIADYTINFTIQGQPVPNATQVVLLASQVVDKSTVDVPADPGSATIPIVGAPATP